MILLFLLLLHLLIWHQDNVFPDMEDDEASVLFRLCHMKIFFYSIRQKISETLFLTSKKWGKISLNFAFNNIKVWSI